MRSRALLLLGAVLLAAAPAHAQIPAAEQWQTIESSHFRVTYTPALAALARHAAAAAERAHAALAGHVASPPRGRIDVVLADNVDLTNGSATPFPGNRIYLYAKPPVDLAELAYVEDWIELVVAHELAHVFHLDATSAFGRVLRGLFGRVPFDWPFFPGLGTPRWSVEGLAVAVESELTSLGRLHGTYFDMVARTAALEDAIDDIDRVGSQSPLWPTGQRAYVYGSLFMDELGHRYGNETLGRIVSRTASAAIPPVLWYDRVGRRAFGTGFRAAYDAWRAAATARYRALADTLRAQGLTEGRVLVRGGGIAAHPRFSRDGRTLVYTANDLRSTPVVRAVDVASGEEQWSRRSNGSAGASWIGEHEVIVPQLEFRDPEHLFYDLYRMGRGGSERLTRGARLQDVDVSPTGARLVAVENEAGSNRLVLLAADGTEPQAITPLDPGVHWSQPRWSPAGDRIAASRWARGGRFDVVVLDTAGALVRELTTGIGVNADPAWSPDGRYVLFASDRTGIANLYAYDFESATLHQVTNLLTGAAAPDVAPDGRSIAYSSYHFDGYRILLLPFDPAGWRTPQPATLPQLPLPTPAAARATTDTLAGAAESYRAGHSARPRFWAPTYIDTDAGDFIGALSFGRDLVGRHHWQALLAVSPDNGRATGQASYSYAGFAPRAGMKPSLGLALARSWDRLLQPVHADSPYIDEREDALSAQLALTYLRWRRSASLALAGEVVQRNRLLEQAPGRRLRDPADRLYGVRLAGAFGNTRTHPLSISPEDGIRLSLSGRQRWDPSPTRFQDDQGNPITLDAGYRELTTWNTAYRALGRTGFANTVLALRMSALLRDGPGAEPYGVGGTSGSNLGIDIVSLGSEFLPVRGYDEDTRIGTRAWSGSAELRIPIVMIAHKPRPLPLFLHSLAFSAFGDAGDASCPATLQCGARSVGPTLTSAGGEALLDAELLGLRTTLRFGVAVPLAGDERAPRAYLQLGSSY